MQSISISLLLWMENVSVSGEFFDWWEKNLMVMGSNLQLYYVPFVLVVSLMCMATTYYTHKHYLYLIVWVCVASPIEGEAPQGTISVMNRYLPFEAIFVWHSHTHTHSTHSRQTFIEWMKRKTLRPRKSVWVSYAFVYVSKNNGATSSSSRYTFQPFDCPFRLKLHESRSMCVCGVAVVPFPFYI